MTTAERHSPTVEQDDSHGPVAEAYRLGYLAGQEDPLAPVRPLVAEPVAPYAYQSASGPTSLTAMPTADRTR